MVKTYYKPKGIQYTVNAGEAGSGIVNIEYSTSDDTRDLLLNANVYTSAGVQKTGFKKTYLSGQLTLENAGSFSFAENDEIALMGMYLV